MPAYQAAETIIRALKSISSQSIVPDEVIVIDDGSSDGTAEIAESQRSFFSETNYQILRQSHRGASAARNKGLRLSKSFYIAFLDADDEWLPDKLELSLNHIIKTNSILISHNYILCDQKGQETVIYGCEKNFLATGDPYVNLYRKGYIATSSVLVEREVILTAGGFDESLPTAQDFALWLSVLKEPGTRFHVFQKPLLRYYQTAGSITTYTERRLKCSIKIALQFFPNLLKYPGHPVFNFWYRLISIHWEAYTSYRSNSRCFLAFGVAIRMPLNVIIFSIILVGKMANLSKRSRTPEILLWLWVTFILGIYLYQFSPFFNLILKLFWFK